MKYRYYRLEATKEEWAAWTDAYNAAGRDGLPLPPSPERRKVGFYDDGSLYNPDGYPEEAARAYIEPRYAEWKAERERRRKEGAVKAVAKRRKRREKLIHQAGAMLLRNEVIGPREACIVCERLLTDAPSIARGIGPECWDTILDWVEVSDKPSAQRLRDRALANTEMVLVDAESIAA
jgi:hypothetical protein